MIVEFPDTGCKGGVKNSPKKAKMRSARSALSQRLWRRAAHALVQVPSREGDDHRGRVL